MSYTHPLLSHAIDANYEGQPPAGIQTVNGQLTAWPDQTWPTDGELALWGTRYQARPDTDAIKNPRRALTLAIDACTTIDEIKMVLKRILR